jgi:hypothetical protein
MDWCVDSRMSQEEPAEQARRQEGKESHRVVKKYSIDLV